ncbi:MAG: DNA polymerase III subunit delta [Leptolinea sp.]
MNQTSTPHIYFLHGDDPAGLEERLDKFSASLGDPVMAELNLTRLDGRSCDENDIRNAAMSFPFLADHRIVIVHNPLSKITVESQRKRFTALLSEVPPTTLLVLVIPDESSWRKDSQNQWGKNWKTLSPTHWLMKWASANPGKVKEEGFALPDQREMPKWILEEAKKQGGQFTPQAAAVLAEMTGSETQIARLEIEKMLMYVDFQRPVTDVDVSAVSISQNQFTVFQLIDSMVNGERSRALFLLRELLETEEPLSLFGNIVSQFRKMVLIKDAQQNGGTLESMIKDLGIQKFIIEKNLTQCRRFSLQELKKAYLRLAELDFEMKNGITPGDLAIEYFLLELKPAKT